MIDRKWLQYEKSQLWKFTIENDSVNYLEDGRIGLMKTLYLSSKIKNSIIKVSLTFLRDFLFAVKTDLFAMSR